MMTVPRGTPPALPIEIPAQPNPPPRPTLSDAAVRRRAAESILPNIIHWLGSDWREAQREDYIADLMAVAGEDDGYRAARALERRSWEANADLVEIIDGGWGQVAVYEAEEEWVEANGIRPRYAIGDRVRYTNFRGDSEGEIVAVDCERAYYTVQTAEFLERHPDQAGRAGGHLIAFERCEPA